MIQGLDQSQLEGAIEALLFVSTEPLSAPTLADMLEISVDEALGGLSSLETHLSSGKRGILLREVAGGWRLYTAPVYHDLLEKYVLSLDRRKLSQAALETLAIIAYLQPITRTGLSRIRGVNSDSSINSLLEKNLICEAGVADAPGNPVLYATSRKFLEKFGLRSVSDLPDLESFAPDEATRKILEESLNAPRAALSENEQGCHTNSGITSEFLTRSNYHLVDENELSSGEDSFSRVNTTAKDLPSGDDLYDQREIIPTAFEKGFGLVEKIDFSSLKLEADE